jgi:hypothetical protein
MKRNIYEFLWEQMQVFMKQGVGVDTALALVYGQNDTEIDGIEISLAKLINYVTKKVNRIEEDKISTQIDDRMQGWRL